MYNHLEIKNQAGEVVRSTYKRTVLPDCVWQQDAEATYRATGTLNAESVKLLIPFDPEYFSVQDGEVFLGDGWTVQFGPELRGSYIVKGVCLFEFPPYEVEQGEPGESDDESIIEGEPSSTQETPEYDLFRDYIEPFEKQFKYKRPKEIIEHFVGSRNLWYIETRC